MTSPRFFTTLSALSVLWRGLPALWRGLRSATGDDAYERYLQRWHAEHGESGEKPPDQPLDRKTFHKRRLDEDWNHPRRCC